jgi:hypothetical protein
MESFFFLIKDYFDKKATFKKIEKKNIAHGELNPSSQILG